jgi:SAM-dependent methyltransferase
VLHEKIFPQGKDQNQLRDGMRARAKAISSQIGKYFQGESLADVGCGHGLVGWSARKYFKDILLLDVIDYRDAEVTLPFVEFSANEDPPFGRSFDCTLLITVLHHAHDPMRLLESVWRQTRKRLIVIESVFGVDASNSHSPLPRLDQAAQLSYAVYCDWFYNRVLNQGVFVPYNFNTPDNWRQIFSKLPAWVSFEENLGVDLDIVPEHHFLFILDKA